MFEYFPYALLLLAILTAWWSSATAASNVLLIATIAGLATGRLEFIALPAILLLDASLQIPARWPRLAAIGHGLFLVLAVAMSNFLVPGFHNLPVYAGVRFAPDSVPFTMYLNFDKTVVGLFVILFFHRTSARDFPLAALRTSGLTWAALVATLLPVAVAIHYVRWNPKWPDGAWIWMLNNLFFVCLAEEGLFRGFIQGGLRRWLPAWASIAIAALLFGAAHYKGGVAYVALAALAGLFYGYAFERTRRLEASMLVHFGLNFTHFLLFSYPALERSVPSL